MTQYERITKYVTAFGTITPLEAFQDLGITKLATRVSEMESKGIAKFTHTRTNGKNRYGEPVSYMTYSFDPKWVEEQKEKNNDTE